MDTLKNSAWFESNILPKLEGYEIKRRFFEEGDFGSLEEFEFNSKEIGGAVNFWGLDWLGIYIWDYIKEEEIFNVLLEPGQNSEKQEAFEKLEAILMEGKI